MSSIFLIFRGYLPITIRTTLSRNKEKKEIRDRTMRPSSGTSLDLSHSAVQPKAKFTKLFESSSIPIKERAFGKKRNLKVPIAKLNPQIQSKAPNFSQLETQKLSQKIRFKLRTLTRTRLL